MRFIDKSLCALLILGISTAAFAQATSGEKAAEADEPPVPCVAAGGDLPREGEPTEGATGAEPCEEQVPGAIPGDAVEDAFADAEENELKTTGDDVTAQEEFETGEEISEDYPVPLPSDI